MSEQIVAAVAPAEPASRPWNDIDSKVGGGFVGSQLAIVAIWVLGMTTGIHPPAEVSLAIGGLFMGAGGWLAKRST